MILLDLRTFAVLVLHRELVTDRELQPWSEQARMVSQQNSRQSEGSSSRQAAHRAAAGAHRAEQQQHTSSNLSKQQGTYIVNYSGEVHDLRLIPPSKPLRIPANWGDCSEGHLSDKRI